MQGTTLQPNRTPRVHLYTFNFSSQKIYNELETIVMVIMACPSKDRKLLCMFMCTKNDNNFTSGLLNSVVGSGKAQTITDIQTFNGFGEVFVPAQEDRSNAYLQLVHHVAEDLTTESVDICYTRRLTWLNFSL